MVYPTIYRVSNIQGGAGFLPSTVACQLIGCPFMAERPMHPRTCGFACGSIPPEFFRRFDLNKYRSFLVARVKTGAQKNWSESWIQRQQQVIECLAGIHLTYPYFSFRSSMIPQNLTISIHILPYFSMWMSGAEASNWIRTSSSLLGWTSFSAGETRRLRDVSLADFARALHAQRGATDVPKRQRWLYHEWWCQPCLRSILQAWEARWGVFFSLLLQWKRPRTTSLCLPDS